MTGKACQSFINQVIHSNWLMTKGWQELVCLTSRTDDVWHVATSFFVSCRGRSGHSLSSSRQCRYITICMSSLLHMARWLARWIWKIIYERVLSPSKASPFGQGYSCHWAVYGRFEIRLCPEPASGQLLASHFRPPGITLWLSHPRPTDTMSHHTRISRSLMQCPIV